MCLIPFSFVVCASNSDEEHVELALASRSLMMSSQSSQSSPLNSGALGPFFVVIPTTTTSTSTTSTSTTTTTITPSAAISALSEQLADAKSLAATPTTTSDEAKLRAAGRLVDDDDRETGATVVGGVAERRANADAQATCRGRRIASSSRSSPIARFSSSSRSPSPHWSRLTSPSTSPPHLNRPFQRALDVGNSLWLGVWSADPAPSLVRYLGICASSYLSLSSSLVAHLAFQTLASTSPTRCAC